MKETLEVSAFQIDGLAILTIKDGDELVWSGVSPARHSDGRCFIEIGDKIIHCTVESINDDVAVVGKIENQKRYLWTGKVDFDATLSCGEGAP